MNSIQKKKGALIGLAIGILVVGILALVGGIILIVFGAKNLGDENIAYGITLLIFGIILALGGLLGMAWGIRYIWVGSAVKATKGSIAEDNLAKSNQSSSIIKCPKCGCTNAVNNVECSNCGEPLVK